MILVIAPLSEGVSRGGAGRLGAISAFALNHGGEVIAPPEIEVPNAWGRLHFVFRSLRLWGQVAKCSSKYVLIFCPGYPMHGLMFHWSLGGKRNRCKTIAGYLYAFTSLFILKCLCMCGRKRLIVDVYDIPSTEQEIPEHGRITIPALICLFEALLFNLANHIWVSSSPQGRLVSRCYGVHPRKIIHTPNGSFRFHLPERGSVDSRVRFLYAGSLFREKRALSKLLQVFKDSSRSNAEFYLCGVGGDWVKEHTDERVHYLGPLPLEQCAELARECDIGIIPLFKGLELHNFVHPEKLSFYIVSGLAILCGDAQHVSEIVSTYGIGLATSYENLERNIDRMLQDVDLVLQCKMNARNVSDRFVWENILERTWTRMTGCS